MERINDNGTEKIFRSEHIYELRDINRVFSMSPAESVTALQNVSIDIKIGEIVAIIGPSGSGKTTLLSMLGLIDYVDSGKIYFNGNRVDDLNETDRDNFRMKNIGFIFQSFNLISELSAQANVMLPLLLDGVRWSKAKEKARGMLTLLGLQNKFNSHPSELSGGQQQRVAIARALAKDALVILADEPTANLDSRNSLQLIDLLANLSKEKKITVVLVTHDLEIAKRADRILTIRDGVIAEADEETLLSQPYAERSLGLYKEAWLEGSENESKRSHVLLNILFGFLATLTISSGIVLNSFYGFIPFLVVPQVGSIFPETIKAIQSISYTIALQTDIQKPVKEGAAIVSRKEKQIVNLYNDLMNVSSPPRDKVNGWLDKDYEKTALKFEFVKSQEYQDYLKDILRKKGIKEAIRQLGVAVFDKDPPQDMASHLYILPLNMSRMAMARTSLYKTHLSDNNSNMREVEIEYLFETLLDKAPTKDQLDKYVGSNWFIEDIRKELENKAGGA